MFLVQKIDDQEIMSFKAPDAHVLEIQKSIFFSSFLTGAPIIFNQ